MKKRSLCFAIVFALLISVIFPSSVFAETKRRLYGTDRIETALAVCNEGWPNGASTVILAPANQENLIDALAASSLAGQFNAPILLTDKNTLDQRVINKLSSLNTNFVYIIGAISDSVAQQVDRLSNINIKVLKGKDRFETSTKINDTLSSPTGTIIVGFNALADALSASSLAAANKYAVVIANSNGKLQPASKIYGSSLVVIGNYSDIPAISGEIRVAGADRYERNKRLLEIFHYSYDNVYIANGFDNHLVDSLVVSPLAGRYKAPILLSDNKSLTSAGIVNACINSNSKIFSLGGTGVISDSITNLIKYNPPDLRIDSVTSLSLNLLKVRFSGQVDKTSAENPICYFINGDNLTRGKFAGSLPILQDDMQTLFVQLFKPANQSETIEFSINNGQIYSKYREQTVVSYSNKVTLTDETRPQVEKIYTSADRRQLIIRFTEPVRVPDKETCEKWTFNYTTLKDMKLDSVNPAMELNGFSKELALKFESASFGPGNHKIVIKQGSLDGQLCDAARYTFTEQEIEFTLE